jgi:heptose I phosphotransferase
MLQLSDQLKSQLPAEFRGREFDAIMNMQGAVFRQHKNRRTIRAKIGERDYFIKIHGPTGWGEILKNALRGRWPVLTSKPEWQAIQRLEQLHIPTVHAVGYGIRGRPPHRMESFIITNPLEHAIHLSDLPARLSRLPGRMLFVLRCRIIRELARIARTLHSNGLNHRDFYLCHFMLHDRDWSHWSKDDQLTLHVIDLHRMQIRNRTPPRWIIKDISGLMFSALDAELTSRDYLRFLSDYWEAPWRERWTTSKSWRRAVLRRAVSLYRSEHGREPRLPGDRPSSA